MIWHIHASIYKKHYFVCSFLNIISNQTLVWNSNMYVFSNNAKIMCTQWKKICFWSQLTAELQRFQSPPACLLSLNLHTSGQALLALEMSNILKSLQQMEYGN